MKFGSEEWVKTVSKLVYLSILLAISTVGVVKLYRLNLSFEGMLIDFSTLLALLLAFFAIGLSVTFYFKSSDTANKFYDNTYHFTMDISEKIGRLEERFGEKLTALDSSYAGLRQDFLRLPSMQQVDYEKKKQELEEEVKQMEEEQRKNLQALLTRAKLSEAEKEKYLNEVKEKDEEVQSLRFRLRRLEAARRKERVLPNRRIDEAFELIPPFAKERLAALVSKGLLNAPRQIAGRRIIETFAEIGLEHFPATYGLVDDSGRMTALGKELAFLAFKIFGREE